MDKTWIFVMFGIVLWLTGVLVIHVLGPVIFDGGLFHALFWVANFVLPVVFLPLIAHLTGRTKHDMLVPTAIMAMPAMLMDGVAVTLDALGKTHIYADTTQLSAYTGGFLLFAFWGFFFWALVWYRPVSAV